MERPAHPIAAVTHPDPYPYYADLATRPGLTRDEGLGLWIASSAAAVTAVLSSDLCRVRPATEPVPTALLGSPAGDIFGRLVRMNDGAGHSPMKTAVETALSTLNATRVAEESGIQAHALAEALRPEAHADRVTDFAFRLSTSVLASLLGVPREQRADVASWMSDFVRCLAPGSAPDHVERGKAAAGRLRDTFTALLDRPDPATLLGRLAKEARAVGRGDADVIVANGIGFLSQAYEATAGLIGNTLVAIARERALRDQLRADPGHFRRVVREVVRCDPPVQNTRRFVARRGTVAGQDVQDGDAILVVLAAANRDPVANRDPNRFDMFRADRQAFTFGVGAHACPGEELATTIAQVGVERLLAAGVEPDDLVRTLAYRPSANTRIPLFGRA